MNNKMLMQVPEDLIVKDMLQDWYYNLDLVEFLLENATKFNWTIRGSGRVLRLDINKNVCLHIWNDNLAIDGVSIIHNHSWNLRSYIVVGELINTVYKETRNPDSRDLYIASKINCGVDGGLIGNLRNCYLEIIDYQHIYSNGHYVELYNEIHETKTKPGTVTIVYRDFIKNEFIPDVYWEAGTEIIDSPPKQATVEEIVLFSKLALDLFNKI